MKHRSRVILSGCLLLALLISTALPDAFVARSAQAAESAVRYVTPTGANVGNCISTPCASINFAIGRAAAGDVINIAPGIYTENLQIPKSITLQGAGPGVTIIDGNQIGQVLHIAGPAINITLTGLTIRNGFASGIDQYGAGIYYESSGQLALSAVDIVSNTASGGGGIFAQGRLILNGVRVLNNTAGTQGGGGLRVDGVVDLTNVTIANNRAFKGGGIFNLGGTTRLNNVRIANNHADQNGGGVYINGGTVLSNGGEIRNNTAGSSGGGVFNEQGVVNVMTAVLSGNNAQGGGGGVFNSMNGHFTFSRTWLKDNSAAQSAGGGINNEGTLTMTASTFSGNTVSFLQGGGLRNQGNATLTLVTLSDNTTLNSEGGAVSSEGGLVKITSSTIASNTDPALKATDGTISLENSIVADRSGGLNCSGDITSLGYNLETKNSCNFNKPGDKVNQSAPGLGPLKDNGGSTPTRALAFWSPARNTGTTNLTACRPFDQRGVTRPQPPGGRCDIGAYETIGFQSTTILPVPPNSCVQSYLSIAGGYKIGKLNVGVNATLNPRGDFRVTIISPAPAFEAVTLLGPTGGAAVNLDALFDDTAPGGVPGSGTNNTAPPSYENVYQPYSPLSALNGTLINGLWTLEVCSRSSASGSLNSWLVLVPEVITTFRVYLPRILR